jgi:hypothetical protein
MFISEAQRQDLVKLREQERDIDERARRTEEELKAQAATAEEIIRNEMQRANIFMPCPATTTTMPIGMPQVT